MRAYVVLPNIVVMSITRNNHYVPQWYQEEFFEPGRNTLAYLDLSPAKRTLDNGRIIEERSLFDAPTSRAFCDKDLYSTFFGTSVNDEIERRLFGSVDVRGSKAVKAFAGTDQAEWHRHFQTLFEYIDIQKIRTPKGLDWIREQYPELSQNELMFEMQGIRAMHCTIWAESVREIVSAENADIKFMVTDHPVTIYNHALPPGSSAAAYPRDPSIALRASQTIFPLSRDFCLILTNLEYANDASSHPTEKRTFARNFRNSMVRTDAFIRKRDLSNVEVAQVNFILKARARRYVAASRREWLYPEKVVSAAWAELRHVLMPPKDDIWRFGGKMIVRFNDGRTYSQDQFGRTETEREYLKKPAPKTPLSDRDLCGCGSGLPFKKCCKPKPVALRTSWTEVSIRERNMMFLNAIAKVLDLGPGKDWLEVRQELTDEKIRKIYSLFEGLWPLETDLLSLLPKPDGTPRAVYTGRIHPATITQFALGASLYFGELLIPHPFVNAATLQPKFKPTENPRAYRHEFLKSALFFITVMPLVEQGLVSLVPDPCDFDTHLRDQMLMMATKRSSWTEKDLREDKGARELFDQDFRRSLMSMPREVILAQIRKVSPELDEARIEEVLRGLETMKQDDPLAVMQEDEPAIGKDSGQLHLMKLAPNFEMAMYLAQATGSVILTDNPFRWKEIKRAMLRPTGMGLQAFSRNVEASSFLFPQNVLDIEQLACYPDFAAFPSLIGEAFSYLTKLKSDAGKPNFENHLAARFSRNHPKVQAILRKSRVPAREAVLHCAFPIGGIQHNTVNRLLLMSSSERHLPSVPAAFYIEQKEADPRSRAREPHEYHQPGTDPGDDRRRDHR